MNRSNGSSGGGSGQGVGAKLIAASLAAIGAGAIAIWVLAVPPPPPSATAAAMPTPAVTFAAPPPSASPPSDSPVPSGLREDREVAGPKAEARRQASASAAAVPAHASSSASAEREPRPSRAPESSATASQGLREEAEGVMKARQLLRAKESAAALAELDRLSRLFPSGPLEEEREVLTIEALFAAGNAGGGRRRAERFLFERPQSMHAARVRALAGP